VPPPDGEWIFAAMAGTLPFPVSDSGDFGVSARLGLRAELAEGEARLAALAAGWRLLHPPP
jgi:hypothetical protein